MREIHVRDDQIVLVLTRAEAEETRRRLKSPDGGCWSKFTRSVDMQLEEQLYELDRRASYGQSED